MNRADYYEAVSKCVNAPHDEGPFRYCNVKGCPWTEDGPLDGFDDDEFDLNRRFNYHQPSNQEVVDKHQQVREGCHYAANIVATACPEGREKSLALTKLEEAMMWANAAIARKQ